MSIKRVLRSSLKFADSPKTQVSTNIDSINDGTLGLREKSVKTRMNKAVNEPASPGEPLPTPVKKKARLMPPSLPLELNPVHGDTLKTSNEPIPISSSGLFKGNH